VGWSDLENQSKVILSAGGTSPYEILQAFNGWMPEYIHNQWVLPLNEYVEKYRDEYDLDDISQSLWDVCSDDGVIYGFPFQQNLQHIFYRTDLFEEYNLQPPKTFDELFQVLDVLKEKGDTQYQFALALDGASGAATEFNNALIAFGGEWFDENDNPAFNSEAGVKAIELLKKLLPYMPREVLSYTNSDVSVAFQQELVAVINIWTSRAGEITDPTVSKVADRVGFAPAPSSVIGGIPYTNWTQDMFVIPANVGGDPELIFRFIAETLKYDTMVEAAPLAIGSRSSVAENPSIIAAHPNYVAVMETIENGAKSYPIKPYFGSARLIVGSYVAKALAGEITAEEALKKAEEEVLKDMQEKGFK
jgi:ABC-type glycerol-3-phosphate transport system substrate-binding protein